MKKIFMLDGGAGRIITAIPALKKYIKNNPNDEVKIFVNGWDSLYWSIPELQDITFATDIKGNFNQYFLDADSVITPEPYRLPSYYRQETSLTEAFDEIINDTKDHSDLGPPQIVLMDIEKKAGLDIINQAKQQQGKEKTIVIQPFGRSAERHSDGTIIDTSSRSFEPHFYLELCKSLSDKYNLILMSEPDFYLEEDIYTFKSNFDLRGLTYLVYGSDYFIGCDSLGQHLARALNKPGTVFTGSTFAKNTTYPDHFQIIEKDIPKIYSPIRINDTDNNFANRSNSNCMKFNNEEILQITNQIFFHIYETIF